MPESAGSSPRGPLRRYPEFFGETYDIFFDKWAVELPEGWEPVVITVPEGVEGSAGGRAAPS